MRHVIVLLGALSLLLTAARAHAADSAEYAKLLRDGVQEFGVGNYGEARLLFSRAHDMTPTARTFRGLGLCDFELRHYSLAIDELEAALSDPRRPLTPELRSQVEPVLERARQYVGRYQLRVPAGVTSITVDGKTRPLPKLDDKTRGELLLDPGTHNLEVLPKTGGPIQRELTVEVGARDEIAFMPPPAPAEVKIEAPPLEPLVEPAPLESPQPLQPPPVAASHPRIFTWVAVGFTGVFGAGIVGFGLGAQAKNHTFREQAQMGIVPDPQLKRSGQNFETLTNISIVGCAVAAAAAVTLFIVEGNQSDEEPAAPSVQAGLTPTGAFVSGRF
jgi:hypothetical protein